MTVNLRLRQPKTTQCEGAFWACYTPGKGVKSLDEVVAVIFVSAFQQSGSSMHHVTGQETVLKAKVNTKRLDTDILHTDKEVKTKDKSFQVFYQKKGFVCNL